MASTPLDSAQSATPCQWALGATVKSPHIHQPVKARPLISESVLEVIGETPMIRLNRVCSEDGVRCEVVAKLEFLNPGGSSKDRVALRLVEDAEARGDISPGVHTLVEVSSGNTGTGLALVCAVKGYRCIVVMPDVMSVEKSNTIQALGCEVRRVALGTEFAVAAQLVAELPSAVNLSQFANASAPISHYDSTAEEIIRQCGGRLDYCLVGAGTGSTLTGIARKLKEKVPGVQVVGVDTQCSVLSGEKEFHQSKVEGIGSEFVSRVCHRESVDFWVNVTDQDSFVMARRLLKQEGLLVGGSSGAVVWAATEIGKTLSADKRIVVLLPDSAKNYLSKFIDDNWMIANGFLPAKVRQGIEPQQTLASLQLKDVTPVAKSTTCREAFERLTEAGVPQLPVADGTSIVGVVTAQILNEQLLQGSVEAGDTVDKCMSSKFRLAPESLALSLLQPLLSQFPCVLVQREGRLSVATACALTRFLLANSPSK